MIRIELLQAIQNNIEVQERFTLIIAKPNCDGYELQISSDMDRHFVALLLETLARIMEEKDNGHANQTKH